MIDIINPEFEVQLGGKTFNVKSLSLNSLLQLSKKLKSKEVLKNAEEASKYLPKEERGKFMLDVLIKMSQPQKTEEEFELADSLFSSIGGVIEIVKYAILKNNKIKEEELEELIESDFQGDSFIYFANLAARIVGVPQDEIEEVEDNEENKKKSETELESTVEK